MGYKREASTSELFDDAAQACTRSLIESLAPGGYWKSDDDYWAPSPLRSGSDSTDSFHIFEHEGRYCFKDFAGDSGGDIIALVVALRGGNAKDAAEWILRETGHSVPEARSSKGRRPKAAAVMPIPDEAKFSLNKVIEGEYAILHHGEAVTGWRYHLADGGWAFAVVRFIKIETEKNDKKEPIRALKNDDGTWKYSLDKNGKTEKDIQPYYYGTDKKWHEGKPQKDGLPLYRLPELLASPEKPVLVVEGEKCAEAARKALGEAWAVTTWSSGASSVKNTDWAPLSGRDVIIWPDHDLQRWADNEKDKAKAKKYGQAPEDIKPSCEQPGYRAAFDICALVPSAKILDVEKMGETEGRDGWDIADAIAEGLDVARFIADCPRVAESEPEPPEAEEIDAPFRCIGYDALSYWFLLSAQRQPFAIPKGKFQASLLGELAPPSWWAKHGAISDEGAISVHKAQQIVINRENARGMFDPAILRGAGVWSDRGQIVINDGECLVSLSGERTPLAEHEGEAEYVRSSVRFGDMTGDESTAEEGAVLARLVHAQRWAREVDAMAVLGWSLIAPFGGLLAFRPHLWLSGKKGTGKTFVQEEIIREICGPFAHCGSGKDTEAGIRRTLNMDARPVILDEMEPKGKARENVTRILDLARNASSDGSGRVTMADGKGTISFLIRSCFCFASINTVVEEGAAIASRIILAELAPSKSREEERAKIAESKKLYGLAMGDPGRYRRRIFRALPRIRADIAKLREVLPIYLGSARDADLWSPIFAAAWAVQSDETIECDAGIAWLEAILKEENRTREAVPEDEDRVIEHILSAVVEGDDRKKKTIAEWLEIANKGTSDEGYAYAEDILGRLGLRIMSRDGRWVLAVATRSDALAALLRDTPYGVGYDAQIRRHPLCLTPDTTTSVRMAGHSGRARFLDWNEFRKAYMGAGEGSA